MGFFNSIGQVLSNNKNFKLWEKEQKDNSARRQELAQKNPKSAQELEAAKKQGQVIIDIVDIMDAHSEDVAEKTETATAPIQALIPYFTLLFSGFASYKTLIKPAINDMDKAHTEFIDNENISMFTKKIRAYADKNNIENLSYFWNGDFLKKDKMDLLEKIQDEEIKTIYKKANKIVQEYKNNPAVKNLGKKIGLGAIIPITLGIISFIGSTIFATKLQVNSSRIARWQSREQLKNPKYFVEYTPEQIEQAKQTVEQKEQQEKGFISKLFKKKERSSLIQIIKDNKNYQQWKKTDTDESKIVERELTQDELIQAQKDKEVIQRITKIINNKAEDYSENMEVAADTLIMGTPFLGGAIGALISFIGNKTGILDRLAEKNINKLAEELTEQSAQEVKKAYFAFKKLAKDSPDIKKASKKLSMSILMADFMHDKGTGADVILQNIKKGFNIFISTKGGRNKIFAITGSVVTSIIGLIMGLKLQKASARAGRFLAKRELEQDPNNFIGYSEEELKSVEDIKAQKEPFGKKFKEYITFLPRVFKEYFEYKKYLKTTAAKNRVIKEELVKNSNVDEKQLKDAKNLQRKMFNTFEKVDDKSQEYSESVEAATEIAKPVVMSLGLLSFLSPAIIIGIQIARGKIKVSNVVEKTSKFLADKTDFLKGKTVKKYLKNVNQNLSETAKEISFETRKNMDGFYKDFTDFNLSFSELKNMIKSYKEFIENLSEEEFLKLFSSSKMPNLFKKLSKETDKKQFLNIINNLENIANNIPEESLQEILSTVNEIIQKNPQEAKILLDGENLRKIFLTKDIKKFGAIAAGTWSALNLAITFAIESYLAKLQKEAGRLGVMKALEELEDPRYYANTEKSQENTPVKNENKYLL